MIVKATVCGQEYTLVYNEATGFYEADVTSPSSSSYPNNEGHYFPVSITATDEAGNSTTISDEIGEFTDHLKLFVQEQIKPVVSELSPSNGAHLATSTPSFSFKVLDNCNGQDAGFSGIDPDSIVMTIDGVVISKSEIRKAPIAGGYQCLYTPDTAIDDGPCTVTVRVSDYDGNQSDIFSATFTVDTVPPVLEVSYPDDNLITKFTEITVYGTTSDITSSSVEVRVFVNEVDCGTAVVNAMGEFSKQVQLEKGDNTITVIATDLAGKQSSVTRKVTLKTTKPVFETVGISPNPVNAGKTYTISVSFAGE